MTNGKPLEGFKWIHLFCTFTVVQGMGCKVRSEICETALVEGDCISLGKTRWRPGQVWGQIRRRMLRVSAVSDAL